MDATWPSWLISISQPHGSSVLFHVCLYLFPISLRKVILTFQEKHSLKISDRVQQWTEKIKRSIPSPPIGSQPRMIGKSITDIMKKGTPGDEAEMACRWAVAGWGWQAPACRDPMSTHTLSLLYYMDSHSLSPIRILHEYPFTFRGIMKKFLTPRAVYTASLQMCSPSRLRGHHWCSLRVT